jgi:hypothetical protein
MYDFGPRIDGPLASWRASNPAAISANVSYTSNLNVSDLRALVGVEYLDLSGVAIALLEKRPPGDEDGFYALKGDGTLDLHELKCLASVRVLRMHSCVPPSQQPLLMPALAQAVLNALPNAVHIDARGCDEAFRRLTSAAILGRVRNGGVAPEDCAAAAHDIFTATLDGAEPLKIFSSVREAHAGVIDAYSAHLTHEPAAFWCSRLILVFARLRPSWCRDNEPQKLRQVLVAALRGSSHANKRIILELVAELGEKLLSPPPKLLPAFFDSSPAGLSPNCNLAAGRTKAISTSTDGGRGAALISQGLSTSTSFSWSFVLEEDKISDSCTCFGFAVRPIREVRSYDSSPDQWLIRCYNAEVYNTRGRVAERLPVNRIDRGSEIVFAYDCESRNVSAAVNGGESTVCWTLPEDEELLQSARLAASAAGQPAPRGPALLYPSVFFYSAGRVASIQRVIAFETNIPRDMGDDGLCAAIVCALRTHAGCAEIALAGCEALHAMSSVPSIANAALEAGGIDAIADAFRLHRSVAQFVRGRASSHTLFESSLKQVGESS